MHGTIERIGPKAPPPLLWGPVSQFTTPILAHEPEPCMSSVFLSVLSGFHGRPRAHRGSGRKGQTKSSRLYRSWWNLSRGNPGSILALALDLMQCIFDLTDLLCMLHIWYFIWTRTRRSSQIHRKKVLCSTHSPHCSIPLPERVAARILQYAGQTFYWAHKYWFCGNGGSLGRPRYLVTDLRPG